MVTKRKRDAGSRLMPVISCCLNYLIFLQEDLHNGSHSAKNRCQRCHADSKSASGARCSHLYGDRRCRSDDHFHLQRLFQYAHQHFRRGFRRYFRFGHASPHASDLHRGILCRCLSGAWLCRIYAPGHQSAACRHQRPVRLCQTVPEGLGIKLYDRPLRGTVVPAFLDSRHYRRLSLFSGILYSR